MSPSQDQLSPKFLQMIRSDFLKLLFDPRRSQYQCAADRRLARDLDALGGLASAW